MARKIRIEYAGAAYHVMARGNQGRDIYTDDSDRKLWLQTLAEATEKTGWRIHAWVMMSNHYHLLLETPEPNLVAGMKWFQGAYTQRYSYSSRHGLFGHLYQGRYKALVERRKGQSRKAEMTASGCSPVAKPCRLSLPLKRATPRNTARLGSPRGRSLGSFLRLRLRYRQAPPPPGPAPASKHPRKGSVLSIVNSALTIRFRTPMLPHMARKLRIQYLGAIYHVINLGNHREPVFCKCQPEHPLTSCGGRTANGAESYFQVVSTHIHLNPARAGLIRLGQERLNRYRWSIYHTAI
jgi:REP element-mobilizing transposase RayT